VIPATIGGKPVRGIGYRAFYNYRSLASVTIPDRVTAIGVAAFSGCDNLKPEVRTDIEKRFGKEAF
jgi:hypothetical protein